MSVLAIAPRPVGSPLVRSDPIPMPGVWPAIYLGKCTLTPYPPPRTVVVAAAWCLPRLQMDIVLPNCAVV
jgi:hypothetical protein